MQFSTIYSRVESLANVTNQRALIKDAIQIALYRSTAEDLPYLMTDGYITTVAPYETGTVTVTNGSKTVTGSGTTFTAAMVSRKFKVSSDNAYYRISAFVSTTEITLETPYEGTTASAKTYTIFKDEYRLAPDLDVYKVMRQLERQIALTDIDNTAFDILNPSPISSGQPSITVLVGTKLDTYTTGTVSVTVNASTVTGVSTVWTGVEGLAKGSKITIGVYVYTVKSVDSDTQITIYEKASATASTSTYSISLDNYILQLASYPDSAKNIYYKYQRLPFILINDEDVPDLPDQWHHVLITGGLVWAWELKDKEESKRYQAMFGLEVQEMWGRIGYISVTRNRPRWNQDDIEMSRLRLGTLQFPSGYGIPISYNR